MKNFNKKFISLFSVLCLLLIALCGCGKKDKRDVLLYEFDEEKNEDKTQLAFFGFKADSINLTAIETAMRSFMEEHQNVRINYEGIKGTDYWDAFKKRDAANVLDDVFMIRHDYLIAMSSEGKLADLSDISGIDNYTAAAKGQFLNADGSVYFLPTVISTYNLYINYDLLEKNDLSVPENWSEFQACCDYFVDKGIVPIIANNFNSLPTLITSKGLFDVYQQQNTAEILNEYNENPKLLAKDLIPGIEQVADMINRGWFSPEEVLATSQTSDDLKLFLKGDRPFMITGGWASVRVIAESPDFSYGVYPYPVLDDGSVLSVQVDTCISVNAKSENLEIAKDFVEYLIQPDVMWNYCDSQASYTPLMDNRHPSEKTLIPSTEYLTNGRVVVRSDYRLNLPMEAALTECATVLLNGGTVSEAEAALVKILSE